jgi:glutathione S-transferase
VLRQTRASFDEVVIPLDRPEAKAEILAWNPASRVPALKAGGMTIWDSLAIVEYLAERYPEAGLWPRTGEARALARSVAAEMHAGFPVLRRVLPMDLMPGDPRARRSPPASDRLSAEIARVVEIWTDCRTRFGAKGDFLFGEFSVADAFYAPVVTRFAGYGVAVDGAAAAYRDAVMAWPALRDWIAAAQTEPWIIENP